MNWSSDLDEFQKKAAAHRGSHARLLAGPGTGKSHVLARRVLKLVVEDGVSPQEITALVFTRVNSFDLRRSIKHELETFGITSIPVIKTLHSYALEQLLKNSRFVTSLPQPLRIADDYEEKELIQSDLSTALGLGARKAVRTKFSELASDWQDLSAAGVHYLPPDPRFLGAWEEHRNIYGYVLRLELLWRLKRAVEENPEFSLDVPSHLLVDEYQDLNRCDLDTIAKLVERGAELFCAGDDDQSIYGFRLAHPEGIRNFSNEYAPSANFELRTCWRCDKQIINLAQFVANMDPQRLEKPLEPRPTAGEGEVVLLRFNRETSEASGVASICRFLVDKEGYQPDDILILLRSDFQSLYSSKLMQALRDVGLATSVRADAHSPLDEPGGRYLLSLMRLRVNEADDLAWRTLLEKVRRGNQIGTRKISEMYQYAAVNGLRFSQVVKRLAEMPDLLSCGNAVKKDVEAISLLVLRLSLDDDLNPVNLGADLADDNFARSKILEEISALADEVIEDEEEKATVLAYIQRTIEETLAENYTDILRAISRPEDSTLEQELEKGVVNILTMHRAKGLSAAVVFIVGAEDELLPGNAHGAALGDERRLLYVSLTRAKHRLYITYCSKRYNRQQHTGRNRGRGERHLTQFLSPLPQHILRREDGGNYIQRLGM